MSEMDAFELRVADALLWYADDVSTSVDAAEVAHRVGLEHPRTRVGALSHRLAAIRHLAWVLVLLGVLLATTLAGLLIAGSKPAWKLPAVVPPVVPIAWPTWSPASSADAALVDRMIVVWSRPGMAGLEEVFAQDLVFTVEGEVYGGFDGLRQNPPTVSIARVGDVAVTTDAVPGLWSLPAGSRFLAFVADTSGQHRDWVLEVDDEDRIAVFYNDAHVPQDQRARDGYTPVDFTMIAGLEAKTLGMAVPSETEARLSLVETERVGAADVPGCTSLADGSTYVFIHLRLEGLDLRPGDVAADTVEVRRAGGERLEPASCQRDTAFQPASGALDGWLGVVIPAEPIGRMSLVFRHFDGSLGGQEPVVHEALIPFDLPPA